MASLFRRKNKNDVDVVVEAQSTGSEVEPTTTPEAVRNADAHMKRLRDQHRFDPYMDIEKIDAMESAIQSGDPEKEAAVEAQLISEDSPYAEVRAAVCISCDHPMLRILA